MREAVGCLLLLSLVVVAITAFVLSEEVVMSPYDVQLNYVEASR